MSTFDQMSQELFFTGVKDVSAWLDKHGVEYRKGKTIEDLHKARQKALKAGRGKTEFELSFMELYLKDVLKVKRS